MSRKEAAGRGKASEQRFRSNIGLDGREPKAHSHVVVGRPDGTVLGGHLAEAHVWPTLEVVLTESPRHPVRIWDRESGLAVIRLDDALDRAE